MARIPQAEIDRVRWSLDDYLLRTVPRRHGNYDCPLCGGRGSLHTYSVGNGQNFHCFRCGEGGDLYTLVGRQQGLDPQADFRRIHEVIAGGVIDTSSPLPAPTPEIPRIDPPRGLFRDYVRQAIDTLWSPTGEHGREYLHSRGLSDETLQAYCVGYELQHGNVVLPYDGYGSYYTERSTRGAKLCLARGEQTVDGRRVRLQRPLYWERYLNIPGTIVVLVEGEIDAMSVYEIAKSIEDATVLPVALGGTEFAKRLITLVESGSVTSPILLSLDHDEVACRDTIQTTSDTAERERAQSRLTHGQLAGERTTREIETALDSIGHPHMTIDYTLYRYPVGLRKDPNDLLIGSRTQFEIDLTDAVHKAQAIWPETKIY